MRPKAMVLAATMALAGAIAGCASPAATHQSQTAGPGQSNPGAGSTAAGADACALLTSTEITAATGLAVTGNGVPALQGGKECHWVLEPGKNVEGVAFERFVDISIFGRSYFEGAKAVQPAPEAISGIGDQAVYANDVLVAIKGDRSFALTVTLHEAGNGTAELTTKEHDAALSLGKQAAPRF